jgi:hypothetical protein
MHFRRCGKRPVSEASILVPSRRLQLEFHQTLLMPRPSGEDSATCTETLLRLANPLFSPRSSKAARRLGRWCAPTPKPRAQLTTKPAKMLLFKLALTLYEPPG